MNSRSRRPQRLTLTYPDIFRRLASGHRLVTANNRLARFVTEGYSRWRIDQGDRQWPAPLLDTWEGYITQTWEAAGLAPGSGTQACVLAHEQLIQVWQRVLAEDHLLSPMLRVESLAPELAEARQLMVLWQLPVSDPSWKSSGNENHESFLRWNRAFEALCRNKGWMAPEDRYAWLTSLENFAPIPDAQLDLLGFEELNPAQEDFLASLVHRGVEINHLDLEPLPGQASYWKASDEQDELDVMSRWVRLKLEADPACKVGIVVHDLERRREEIERHLAATLVPGEMTGTGNPPWNVSLGPELAGLPMVSAALNLFRLLEYRFDIGHASSFLRSPWFHDSETERDSRALLEKRLRSKYPKQVNLSELKYLANERVRYDESGHEIPAEQQEPRPWNSPGLAVIIRCLERFRKESGGARSPSEWGASLDRLLTETGWASGDAGRDCWEVLQAWRECLRDFAALDATTTGLYRNDAILQISRMCQERVFQPASSPKPVQVLGLWESMGQQFDHLWVAGLHAGNWPPPAQPNPFIPTALQSRANLPHSTPRREMKLARQWVRRLCESAPGCLFSYPGQLDGEDVLPSPLLAGITSIETASVPRWDDICWQTRILESGTAVSEALEMPGQLSGARARGGSRILKHQALCPFRAFAEHRLAAEGLEAPSQGLDGRQHGTLLHAVLEAFWSETGSQSRLLAMSPEQVESSLRKHIETVLDSYRGLRMRPELRAIESARLTRHIGTFLELERQRAPFEVVAQEQEVEFEIAGQAIRLFIDRVDRTEDGRGIIIDYKSGKVKPAGWFGSRPEDPQLPLYAISSDTTPAAIVFAVLRDDGCEFKGIASEEGLIPDVPPKASRHNLALVEACQDLPSTIAAWREDLSRLVKRFLSGEAAVDPLRGRNTCRDEYCELQPLCRIDELRPESEPEAETAS